MPQAARLLFGLAHSRASGTGLLSFPIAGQGAARITLVAGWVHAIDLEPARALLGEPSGRAEDALGLLLDAADRHHGELRFDPHARPSRVGACDPFHPAICLRRHVESRAGGPGDWRRNAAGARITLSLSPHLSCLDVDERPLVSFLGEPRTVAEIDAAGLCPRPRADRLLGFLDAVGALRRVAPASALALLGVAEGASSEEVRRAYRRLARATHPDLHPEASEEERRELQRRFAELSEAYRRLS